MILASFSIIISYIKIKTLKLKKIKPLELLHQKKILHDIFQQ